MRVPALPKIDPIRLDCLLAIGLFVLAQVELWLVGSIPGSVWIGFVAAITGSLPVAIRRVSPLLAFAVVTATIVGLNVAVGPPSSVAFVTAWICTMYGLAVWTGRRDFVVGCGALFAGIAIATVKDHAGVAGILVWAGIPLLSTATTISPTP